MRKGMGKGQGKGYKNLTGRDPKVHSMSAKGMKQPQRMAMAKINKSLTLSQAQEKLRGTPLRIRDVGDKFIFSGGYRSTEFIEKKDLTPGFIENAVKDYKKNHRLEKKLRKEAQALMEKTLKGKTVTIIGRRWFEKTNGNTYHSCEVYINGKLIGREPYAYGYDNQFQQTAFEILQENNLAPNFDRHTQSGFQLDYSEFLNFKNNNRDKFVISVTDVESKKDL
jgi:hypothetical protein